MLKKLSLIIVSVASAFAMHNAEININDKDLEISTKLDMGQFNDRVEPNTTFVGATYLKASDEYSSDEDDNNTDVNSYYEFNFLMKREVRDTGVVVGIGVKSNYTKVADEIFMSIPLGLEVGYRVPVEIPVNFSAKVYYAPESLAFESADSYFEYRIDASVELIEKGYIIAGFRSLDTNFKINSIKTEINYNTAPYFGFRFDF